MKLTAGVIFFNVLIAVNFEFGATHQDAVLTNGEKEISLEELGDWLSSMKTWADVETNMPKNMTSGSRVVDTSSIRFFLFYNHYHTIQSSSSAHHFNSTNSNPVYCWNEIKIGDPSTIPVSFIPLYPIKFLVHGWCQSWKRNFPQVVIKSYLSKRTKANLIAVDWESLATVCTCSLRERENRPAIQAAELFSYYHKAVQNAPSAGEHIAQFIGFLTEHGYTIPEKIHCIGHSLGAHVCGYAGQAVMKTMDSRRMGRITGLDPAGPLFYGNTVGRRLSSRDATFVDVIHTDAKLLGNFYTMGHVDVYPNGGHAYQPFCPDIMIDFLNLGPMQFFQLICHYNYSELFCSHMKAGTYFAISLFSEIPGYRCSEVAYAMADGGHFCSPIPSRSVIIGEYCSRNARGWYYTSIATRS